MRQLMIFRFYDANANVDNSKGSIEREVESEEEKMSYKKELNALGWELEHVYNQGEY